MERQASGNSDLTGTDKPSFYTVLGTQEFFQDQIHEVQKAEIRSWIQAMALEPSYFSNLLIHSLTLASQRGVDVRFVHDAYSDFVTNNTFNQVSFLLRPEARQQHAKLLTERTAFLQEMHAHFPVKKTNIPHKLIPQTPLSGVMGRDHKKLSLIDNIAYVGGVNFTSLDARRIDIMLKTNNERIVAELTKIFHRSFFDDEACDIIAPCDDNNTILVDAGNRGKSIIMEHVYDLISREKSSILIISPYVPSGRLRKMLNLAVKNDVRVELITTGKTQIGLAQKMSQLVHDFGSTPPLFKIYRHPGIIHAKALVLGDHTAILGSHNFDEIFVRLGTEEICLLTQQSEILSQLDQFAGNLKNATS